MPCSIDERGQALLEALIVIPVLVVLLLGVVTLARVTSARLQADVAARGAAWEYGRGAPLRPAEVGARFFGGAPAERVRVAPLPAEGLEGVIAQAADRLSAAVPAALRKVFDPGDLVRLPPGTHGAAVAVEVGPLPLVRRSVWVGSTQHVDADPWKEAGPLAALLRAAGWAMGWLRSVKPAVQAQKEACDTVLDVVSLGAAVPAHLARSSAEVALGQVLDQAIGVAVRLVEEQASVLGDAVLTPVRDAVVAPMEERILGPLMEPFDSLSGGFAPPAEEEPVAPGAGP